MSTKHTPGPWIVCECDLDNTILSIEQDRNFCRDGEPAIVAEVEKQSGKITVDLTGEGLNRTIGHCNADLIAAAPDMFDALKSLFEHCAMVHKHWGEGCNIAQANAAKKAGEAALAKAAGLKS